MQRLLKNLILTALFLCIVLPSQALILQGNAEFNAELAREETFSNIHFALEPDAFKDYWYDPNFLANYSGLKNGETKIADRYLALFSDGTYGVRYENDPYHNYYYNEKGALFKVDVLNKPYNEYPHRSIAYNKYGAFKNATYVVSKDEQYLYDAEKRLIGHWIDNACYDARGNVLMLRKIAE